MTLVHYPALRLSWPGEGNLDESATAGRRDGILLAALVVFALAVRALRWSGTAVMMNDGPQFIALAQRFAAGDWRGALHHNFHPLYPLATAAVHAAGLDWERAAVAVSVLAGALAVAALFALLREGFGRRAALIGALLLAVQPAAIELSDVQSDPLYLALFVASAALLLRAYQRESPRSALGAGLVSGLAYLTRPEGVGTVLVGLGLFLLQTLRRRWTAFQAARVAVPLCLGAALVMSPYVAYRSLQAGTLTLTGKKSVGRILGISHAPAAKPLDPLLAAHPELSPLPRGVHPFSEEPLPTGAAVLPDAASRLARQVLKALRPEGLLLLALGLFATRGAPTRRGELFASYCALYAVVFFGLAATAGYLSRRHVLPPATLLFGYQALGVLAIAGGLGRMRALEPRPALRLALPLALPLALVAALGLGKALRPDRQDALPERRAAEWIRADGGLADGEAVAAVKQRVGWYAGARFVDLRLAPHPAVLLEYLRREGVRYVVVDESERPKLLAMLAQKPEALRLAREERVARHAAFVYELRPPARP